MINNKSQWDKAKEKVILLFEDKKTGMGVVAGGNKLFINPRTKPLEYQAALSLVGVGALQFNGVYFTKALKGEII